jgi:hypothetical protein
VPLLVLLEVGSCQRVEVRPHWGLHTQVVDPWEQLWVVQQEVGTSRVLVRLGSPGKVVWRHVAGKQVLLRVVAQGPGEEGRCRWVALEQGVVHTRAPELLCLL